MNFVTHAFVFQYSVILNFVCFSPYLKGLVLSCVHCLFLSCAQILFVRSAYIQGYDFIWPHVKIDASQKSSEAGRTTFLCVVLTELHFDPVERCASWRLLSLKNYFLQKKNKSWFVSRLSGAPLLDKVLWLFFGVNILLWAPPPNRTDKATSIYRC